VRNNIAYVADWTNIGIYDCSEALTVPRTVLHPVDLGLSFPFPNPFNSSTTVEVTLPRSEEVNVCLVDITGRVVLTKSFGRLGTGTHNLTISAEGVPSGLYFIQTNLAGEQMVRPVVLMK
jgi:hypothetical protein